MLKIILEKAMQHLFVSFSALACALVIATPLVLFLCKNKHRRSTLFLIRALSLIQTMPGLAMVALIVVSLASFHLPATGLLPGIFALALYGLSPIVNNAYTGIVQASPQMLDVATSLGMTERQRLYLVQVPIALPMIMTGVRIAGVWTIGMGTLTSLVGCGGLGDLIMQGLRSMNVKYVLAGTVPAALLALVFEWGMSALEKWMAEPR